tara:strand:+ start:5917 stop:6900 length:984 start_codon:yes stop_codon:yes gene_type:complete
MIHNKKNINHIRENIPSKYRDFSIKKIESEASNRTFFRLEKDGSSFICMESKKEKENYKKYLSIYSFLSSINISIPKIYEANDKKYIVIMEDFGKLRFDKILSKYKLKNLLNKAVKSLVILKNELEFENNHKLLRYNFNIFKTEISEFIEFYYPYFFHKKIDKTLEDDFYLIWEKVYKSINFDFTNFVHKDYELGNLLYLPHKKKHLKCGIIDYQNAFWGDSSWDLFSLLENPRILFDNSYNDYFIKFYFNNTNQNSSIREFEEKYHILNCSRQTRLMGTWIKLFKKFNQSYYLEFIPSTKKRLLHSLKKINNDKMNVLYSKIIKNN